LLITVYIYTVLVTKPINIFWGEQLKSTIYLLSLSVLLGPLLNSVN